MTDDPADEQPDRFGAESSESPEADGAAADTDSETARDDAEAPLDDLAREVRARREARESRGSSADDLPDDDLFESVDVGQVDDEAVWESFVEGETDPEERVGLGAEAERVADPAEHVVPKRDFCQRCPHFAAPPETACTHDGTDIVEVIDTDSFRVRNCPVVEDEDAVQWGE